MYLWLKKKRGQEPKVPLHETEEVDQHPVFDNPVYEQGERRENEPKDGIEMYESPLYQSFQESSEDAALSRSNPLYLAMSDSSEA